MRQPLIAGCHANGAPAPGAIMPWVQDALIALHTLVINVRPAVSAITNDVSSAAYAFD